jgi:hypothetical protein
LFSDYRSSNVTQSPIILGKFLKRFSKKKVSNCWGSSAPGVPAGFDVSMRWLVLSEAADYSRATDDVPRNRSVQVAATTRERRPFAKSTRDTLTMVLL